MALTLADELELIEKLESVDEDYKKEARRKILNSWREKHQLVDEALRGKSSISGIVNKLLRPYEGWRLYVPTIRGRGYNEELEKWNLNRLLGDSEISDIFTPNSQLSYSDRAWKWIWDKCMNPVVSPFLVGGFMVGASMLAGGIVGVELKDALERIIANYRLILGGSIVTGGGFGFMFTVRRDGDIEEVKKGVGYINKGIQELL